MDIAFSDHNVAKPTLLQLGRVIKAIHAVEPDPMIRYWVFMAYMSSTFPQIMAATIADDLKPKVAAVYGAIDFPPVAWIPVTRRHGPPPTRLRRIGCVLIGIMVIALFISFIVVVTRWLPK